MVDKNKLCGIKEIRDCCSRMGLPSSPASVISMINHDGFPAKKIGGIWISDGMSIESWRKNYIENKPIQVNPPSNNKKRYSGK